MPKPITIRSEITTVAQAIDSLAEWNPEKMRKATPAQLRTLAKLMRWIADALDEAPPAAKPEGGEAPA